MSMRNIGHDEYNEWLVKYNLLSFEYMGDLEQVEQQKQQT